MSDSGQSGKIGKRKRLGSWKLWLPALVTIPLALAATPWLIGPPCPRDVVIVAGPEDGAYYAFAKQYARILERDGITLHVRSSAGSVENCGRFCRTDSDVHLGILQGGTATAELRDRAEALASLYHEPVWVFHRKSLKLTQLNELAGQRVAVGPSGSGTRAIAERLLADNGIATAGTGADRLSPLGGQAAADALKTGKVDALFLVISPKSPLVRDLLASPMIELFSFGRSEAYLRRHPFLASVTLARGTVDLKRDLPRRDTTLLAPTANLIARRDLHPALIPLLMKAAREVHGDAGLLSSSETFPSGDHTDLPLNAAAGRYLKVGPSLLFRYLPFHWAVLLDRLKLMMLPLLTLLIPLVKLTPPLYRWRVRSRIFRLYAVLREVEFASNESPDATGSRELLAQLEELDAELNRLSVPTSYMAEYYDLRIHVDFLRSRLAEVPQPASVSLRKAA